MKDLFKIQILSYMHKTTNDHHDDELLTALTFHFDRHSYYTRYADHYVIPGFIKSTSCHFIEYVGSKAWNELPREVKVITGFRQFKSKLRTMVLDSYGDTCAES